MPSGQPFASLAYPRGLTWVGDKEQEEEPIKCMIYYIMHCISYIIYYVAHVLLYKLYVNHIIIL